MTKNISMRDWEALSAYLDEQLSAKERTRLETQLNQAPELRSALEELRRTRSVLRSQPKVRAPRNFTLTPEMAGLKAGPARRAPGYPFFRLASALAGFLFLMVLVGDLTGLPSRLGLGGAAQPGLVAMAPSDAQLESARGSMKAYPEPTQLPGQAPQSANATQGPLMMMQATPTPGPLGTVELPQAAMPVHPTPQGTPPAVMGGGASPTDSVNEASPEESAALAPPSPAGTNQAYPVASSQAQSGGVSTLRIVEVVLALLAVGSGLIAFFLRRAGPA
jgi:hypothetical protein